MYRRSHPGLRAREDVPPVAISGEISGIWSTYAEPEAYDAYGTIWAPGAWARSIERVNADPAGSGVKILRNHDPDAPIGLPTRLEDGDDGPRMSAVLDLEDDRARATARAIDTRRMEGLSHAFDPLELEELDVLTRWGFPVVRYLETELHEISVVTFPANADAGLERAALAQAIAACVDAGATPDELVRDVAHRAHADRREVYLWARGDLRPCHRAAAAIAEVFRGPALERGAHAIRVRHALRSLVPTIGGDMGERLGAALSGLLDEAASEERPREQIVLDVAESAGVDASTINEIANGTVDCPPEERLSAIASALGASAETLISAAAEDGCRYGDDDEDDRAGDDDEDEERAPAAVDGETERLRARVARLEAETFRALFTGAVREGRVLPREESDQRALFDALGVERYRAALERRSGVPGYESAPVGVHVGPPAEMAHGEDVRRARGFLERAQRNGFLREIPDNATIAAIARRKMRG